MYRISFKAISDAVQKRLGSRSGSCRITDSLARIAEFLVYDYVMGPKALPDNPAHGRNQ